MDGITLALIILIPTLSLIFGFTVLAYYSIKNWQAEQERRAARKAALEQWLANPTQDVNQWNWVGQKYDSNAFLNYYRSLYGCLDEKDYSGVYVIKNLNNNSYYIGQSIKILRRVKSHLSGKGNGDDAMRNEQIVYTSVLAKEEAQSLFEDAINNTEGGSYEF